MIAKISKFSEEFRGGKRYLTATLSVEAPKTLPDKDGKHKPSGIDEACSKLGDEVSVSSTPKKS